MNSLVSRESLMGLAKRLSSQIDDDKWHQHKDYTDVLSVLLFDGKPYDKWTSETWKSIPLTHLAQTLNFKKSKATTWLSKNSSETGEKLLQDLIVTFFNRGDEADHYHAAQNIGIWLQPLFKKYQDIFKDKAEKSILLSHSMWAMLLESGWVPSQQNLLPDQLIFPSDNFPEDTRSFYLAVLKDPLWQPILSTEQWQKLLKVANIFWGDNCSIFNKKFINYTHNPIHNLILNGFYDTDQQFCWLRERLHNVPAISNYCHNEDEIMTIFRTMQEHAPKQLQTELKLTSAVGITNIKQLCHRYDPTLAAILQEELLRRQVSGNINFIKSKTHETCFYSFNIHAVQHLMSIDGTK